MSATRSIKVLGVAVVVAAIAVLPFLLQHHGANATVVAAAEPTPSSDTSTSPAPDPSTSAVEQAFEQAMTQHQHSGALLPSEVTQLLDLGSMTSTAATTQRTQILKQVRVRDLKLTNKYFTGSQYKVERSALTHAIKAVSTGLLFTDGGVTNVNYSSVVVNGKSAIVTAAVTVYTDTKPLGQPEATPSNVLDATATMQKDVLGRWRMAKLVWTFEPGTGP